MPLLSLTFAALLLQSAPPAMPPRPPYDPEVARRAIRRDAEVAIAAAADPSVSPIPLSEDAPEKYGFIMDRFLSARVAAMEAAKAGKSLKPEDLMPPARIARHSVFVVAFPLNCEGRRVLPKSIAIVIERGIPPNANTVFTAPVFQNAEIVKAAGVPFVPEGSILQDSSGVAVQAAAVTVTYDGPVCESPRDSIVFRFKQTTSAGGSNVTPVAKLPADSKTPWPAMVQILGWIDTKGELQGATASSASAELASAALAVASQVRRSPTRINGVPVYQQASVGIPIVGDGEPTAPVPINPGPALSASMSSTINGRIPVRSTYDWPGLTLANSQCATSDDRSFGTTPDHPIKVGGGDVRGPARELAYLNVLRGGSGQGTRFRRLGSATNAEGTILDIYELTFDGLPKPVLLYVDEYGWEEPKAPYGLACLVPIPLTKDGGTNVVK